MLKVRIVPLLLLKGSSLVKSVNYRDHRVVGDAVSAIKVFSQRSADEMVILDLDANARGELNTDLLSRIATFCNMPVAFGGGINSAAKADQAFRAGADKLILNSLFFLRPALVEDIVYNYGSQSICLSIDVRRCGSAYDIFINNATLKIQDCDLKTALRRANDIGIGEILINCIDRDGVMGGMDLELVKFCRDNTPLPLIAAGGIGSKEDFFDGFQSGADAIGAGSIFHWVGESIVGIKSFLDNQGINVRLP